ncbi:MAG: MTH938/NDUFAF3 family protein [Patescibacteria group bacterium]
MIEEYHFGFIKIDGKTYNHDVLIGLDDKVGLWWRNQSHQIEKRDIEDVLNQKPEVIVIGAGELGAAMVSKEAREEITAKGIGLVVEPTMEAVRIFNDLKKIVSDGGQGKKVAGFFHLTC